MAGTPDRIGSSARATPQAEQPTGQEHGGPGGPAGPRSVASLALPALLLSVVLLPFLGKAFSFGEVFFLIVARQRLQDGLRPLPFRMVWGTEAYTFPGFHGPVSSYVLLPALLTPHPEVAAHLMAFLALGVALIATVRLARRLGLDDRSSSRAALLVASSPAVLALSSTAMPDVFSLACSTLGVERAFAWREAHRRRDAVASALGLALAVLFREHAVSLLPVLALGILWSGQEPRRSRLVALLPVVLGVLAWLALGWLSGSPVGSPGGLARLARSSAERTASNLLALFSYWGLATPLVLSWVLIRWRRLPWRLGLVCALALLLPVHAVFGQPAWVAAIIAASLMVFADIGRVVAGRKEDAFLLAWLFLAVPVAAYDHMAAKYLVASAPAAAILVARELSGKPPQRAGWTMGLAVAGGALLGLAIIRADAVMAELARRAAAELVKPQVALGKTVWCPAEWSFRWYGEEAGCRPFALRSTAARPGDLVVAARGREILSLRFPARRRLGTLRRRGGGGRIMSREVHAGFYSNHWGYLPWAWSGADLPSYGLWLIE
jgi:hypothetical protein